MIKKGSMVKRTYYFPLDLLSRIAKHAESEGISSSDVLRLAAKEYLKKRGG